MYLLKTKLTIVLFLLLIVQSNAQDKTIDLRDLFLDHDLFTNFKIILDDNKNSSLIIQNDIKIERKPYSVTRILVINAT